MLLCFRCTPETKGQLDALVASGSYRDPGEAIAAAVSTLVLLEKEFTVHGHIVLEAPVENQGNRNGQEPVLAPLQRVASPQKTDEGESEEREAEFNATRSGGNGAATQPVAPKPLATLEVPRIFRLEAMPQSEPRGLVDLPADVWHHGQEVPLDRWILGQFNRLLPAKANSRALIHLFHEKGALGIDVAAHHVADEALNLGHYLAFVDEKHRVQRDDALSTAFPQRKKNTDKARARYANQFVAYQNSRGELSGLMIDLKLINVDTRRRERRIIPTHLAWEFAKLENPILDGITNGVLHKFTVDEKEFLIQHILRDVPAESFAYWVILQAVIGGSNTPDTIDNSLKKYVAHDRAKKLSQSFLTSQRSGAISRMSDLGLIERERGGVRVTYAITKEGSDFLSRFNKKPK